MSNRCCEGFERQFDRGKAERELQLVQRRGPRANTRRLIEQLRVRLRSGDSLLDIGAGVGAIYNVLLDAGLENAIHLDASSAYIDVAREEASKRGHAGRVRFVTGDFVAVADSVPMADIVTLDRVICCYPDMDTMVSRAAVKTRRILGAVYPRDAWWVRVSLMLENLVSRVRKSSFRVYLHDPAAIEARLQSNGLRRVSLRRSVFWEIATFERVP